MSLIYVGRNTYFGNPVIRGKKCPVCKKVHKEDGETLPCYEKYLRARLSGIPARQNWGKALASTISWMPNTEHFQENFDLLKHYVQKGDQLACPGCKRGSPTCHARILEKLMKEE